MSGEQKQLDNTINSLTSKLSAIKDVNSKVTSSSAVGTNRVWRWAGNPFGGITGERQEFIGKVQQLVSQETLDAVIKLKSAACDRDWET